MRRSPIKLVIASGCVLLGALGSARPALAGEDARVLPPGIGRLGFAYARSTGITQQFDSSGHVESITAPYNIDLSSGNLSSFAPQLNSLIQGLNQLMPGIHYNVNERNNGFFGLTTNANDPTLGDALSRGFLSVGAEAVQTQGLINAQFGVTERLSVGLMVPIIHNSVTVSHDISGPNTALDIYHALQAQNSTYGGSPLYNQMVNALAALGTANDTTLQNILVSRGYAPFQDYNGTGLGDIVAGARYNYWKQHLNSGDWLSSAQLGLTIPTGKLRPPSQLTQIDFGQGAWDVGVGQILNYSPNTLFTFTNGWHWTHRFWDTRLMRVRSSPTDLIPDASEDQEVNQFIGDKYWLNLGADIHATGALTFSTNYEWFWQTHQEYSGSNSSQDYSYMGDASFIRMQTWSLGVSLTSVPGFMRHELPVPVDISFNVFIPVNGMNTPVAPYGLAQLAVYF